MCILSIVPQVISKLRNHLTVSCNVIYSHHVCACIFSEVLKQRPADVRDFAAGLFLSLPI